MESTLNKTFPITPSYVTVDVSELGGNVGSNDAQTFTPPTPPAFSLSLASGPESPLPGCVCQTPAKAKFVRYETILHRKPGLTTCPYCLRQVTTEVTYRAGALAWTVCVTMALFGLVLGCCLIPLMVDYFKDTYHSCPRCTRVLHVHKRGCCE